jgi:hypothetical protein
MDRLSKKLDTKYTKYMVTEVIGNYSYRLDMPPGIYNVFYIYLLKLAIINPLPGQVLHKP